MGKLAYGLLCSLTCISQICICGVRDHTRSDYPHSTPVTDSQAAELTLTLVRAALQNLQTWVRTAAVVDPSGRRLSTYHCSDEAEWVKPAQRVRAFRPESKSSVYQAKVVKVTRKKACSLIEILLTRKVFEKNPLFVIEIVVQRGQFLSIPNEAIIEEENKQIVYIQKHQGVYIQKIVRTGIKGELYTEIVHGLKAGDQVVTLGSFFIDAEHKLKSEGKTNAHSHH